jgi:hypothetical protein
VKPIFLAVGASMDIVYIAITAGLFALSWGLVRLCDRV